MTFNDENDVNSEEDRTPEEIEFSAQIERQISDCPTNTSKIIHASKCIKQLLTDKNSLYLQICSSYARKMKMPPPFERIVFWEAMKKIFGTQTYRDSMNKWNSTMYDVPSEFLPPHSTKNFLFSIPSVYNVGDCISTKFTVYDSNCIQWFLTLNKANLSLYGTSST